MELLRCLLLRCELGSNVLGDRIVAVAKTPPYGWLVKGLEAGPELGGGEVAVRTRCRHGDERPISAIGENGASRF